MSGNWGSHSDEVCLAAKHKSCEVGDIILSALHYASQEKHAFQSKLKSHHLKKALPYLSTSPLPISLDLIMTYHRRSSVSFL